MPRQHVLPRCAFKDPYGRRCSGRGLGNPPFCQTHFDLIYEVEVPPNWEPTGGAFYERPGDFDDMPDAQDLLSSILRHPLASELLDTIGAYINRAKRAEAHPPHYRGPHQAYEAECPPRPRGAPRPPPRPSPPPSPPPAPPATREDPRVILGFGQQQQLTAAEVKKRQHELAQFYHPDRGGSDEGMRRINAAVDLLISQLP